MIEKFSRGNKIHIFICVNEKITGNYCSKQISIEDFNILKDWNKETNFPNVLLTKTGCLGVCNPNGGVIAAYPSGNFYKGINSIEEIKNIIKEELELKTM